MLLEQHLLQLFGNLPYLPKAEIAKHLDDVDLIKATLVSENWDKAIECRKIDVVEKRKKVSPFDMTSKADRVELRIFDFRSSETKTLLIDFPVESALGNSVEIDEYGGRVICHSENFEEFENQILATFHKIRTLFHVVICEIQVNLDHGFNLEFLKKLGLEKFGSFVLSGDKKNCQIDSKELTDLMNTWEIERSVRIRVETIGKFEGNSKMLRGSYCEFADSRWITSDMFNQFNEERARFKRCLLTSQDFNQLFKQWRNWQRNNMYKLECHMEHELDVGKVLEGLRAERWDPWRRGRTFMVSEGETDTYIDLADGMDISRSGRSHATIHISADKKVIRFFYWYTKFPLGTAKKNFTSVIERLKPKLEQFVWSPRELERMAKRVEDYEAKLRAVVELIDRENQ